MPKVNREDRQVAPPGRAAYRLSAVLLALALFSGCGGSSETPQQEVGSNRLIDAAKTATALEQNLWRSTGQRVSSADCPSGIEVKAGTTFECTVELAGGKTERR